MNMVQHFTARYTSIPSGYMGQLLEWPEVITEGATLDECREMLKDALKQMIAAHHQLNKPIPETSSLFEHIPVEV